jgi:hypothetical protein
VDVVGHIDDGLDQGLVPLADGTGEAGARGGVTGRLVDEVARLAAPVVVRAGRVVEQVGEDLTVDLEGDRLREDLGQLDFGVEVLVCGQVLRELRGPLRLELPGVPP